MSVIKPINFAQMYQQANLRAGSKAEQLQMLVGGMSRAAAENHQMVMAPSPLRPIYDAGAKGTQVKMVVEKMDEVSQDALSGSSSKGPIASALRKLDII